MLLLLLLLRVVRRYAWIELRRGGLTSAVWIVWINWFALPKGMVHAVVGHDEHRMLLVIFGMRLQLESACVSDEWQPEPTELDGLAATIRLNRSLGGPGRQRQSNAVMLISVDAALCLISRCCNAALALLGGAET